MKRSVVFITQLRAGYGIDVVSCIEDNSPNQWLILLILYSLCLLADGY